MAYTQLPRHKRPLSVLNGWLQLHVQACEACRVIWLVDCPPAGVVDAYADRRRPIVAFSHLIIISAFLAYLAVAAYRYCNWTAFVQNLTGCYTVIVKISKA